MILMYFQPNALVSHFEGVFELMNQEAAAGDKGLLPDCHPQLYFYHSMLKIGVVSQDLTLQNGIQR
jgi:hypothetical protein